MKQPLGNMIQALNRASECIACIRIMYELPECIIDDYISIQSRAEEALGLNLPYSKRPRKYYLIEDEDEFQIEDCLLHMRRFLFRVARVVPVSINDHMKLFIVQRHVSEALNLPDGALPSIPGHSMDGKRYFYQRVK